MIGATQAKEQQPVDGPSTTEVQPPAVAPVGLDRQADAAARRMAQSDSAATANPYAGLVAAMIQESGPVPPIAVAASWGSNFDDPTVFLAAVTARLGKDYSDQVAAQVPALIAQRQAEAAQHAALAKAAAAEAAEQAKEAAAKKAADDAARATDLAREAATRKASIVSNVDPALDRKAAAQELAARFKIVPDDSPPAKRLPNEVTQAEFDRIVAEYSDIRCGRSNLAIDPSGSSPDEAAAFRSGAMTDIAAILQTPSGRQLVDLLAHQEKQHTTTIEPSRVDGKLQNLPETDVDNQLGMTNPGDREENLSNGVGADMQVTYLPGGSTAGSRSDVILFHELVHARDGTTGTEDEAQVSPSEGVPEDMVADFYGNHLRDEEHQAVGIGKYANEGVSENSYRRDRNAIGAGGVGALDGDATMAQRSSYRSLPGSPSPELVERIVQANTNPDGSPQPLEMVAAKIDDYGPIPLALQAIAKVWGQPYATALTERLKAAGRSVDGGAAAPTVAAV